MAFDDATILEALAAHIKAATPPAGETLKQSFAYPPDGMGATPAVVLYPGGDSIAYGASNRQTNLSVTATLYLPLVEYARNYARTAKWLRRSPPPPLKQAAAARRFKACGGRGGRLRKLQLQLL